MKKQSLILFFTLVFSILSPGLAMEPEDLLEKLRQFQQKSFFEPSEETKKSLREQKQQLHKQYRRQIPVAFYAVENIQEVDNILKNDTLSDPNVHQVGFMDLDDTLFFEEALGWIAIDVKKFPPEKENLLLTYGFKSLYTFAQWGNKTFPNAQVRSGDYFFYTVSVTEPNVPGILESWHSAGRNIFGLTSRDTLEICYTNESLKESGIHFPSLSHLVLENDEINFRWAGQQMDSGIIYSSDFGKFGANGSGIKFLEAYLGKLSKGQPCPPAVEILIMDDSDQVLLDFCSESNINAIQRLEKMFNTKMSVKYFQPFSYWRSPDKQKNQIESEKSIDISTISLQALNDFLQTFATHLKKLPLAEKENPS